MLVEPVRQTERSPLFIRLVENFESSDGLTSEQMLEGALTVFDVLPSDDRDKNAYLVRLYTGNALYAEVNRCLREDDETTMATYAGFIRDLRDVFRTNQEFPVVSPFHGLVRRGIYVDEPLEYVKGFRLDEEFVWPSFTSTSAGSGFHGNVCFEIRCYVAIDSQAQYTPASIAHLSAYECDEEVLFPPHVKFRVVNVNVIRQIVLMETIELPSVWQSIAERNLEGLQQWADANSDRLDSKDNLFSLINSVAEKWLDSAGPDDVRSAKEAFKICFSKRADINEQDDHGLGATPLLHVVLVIRRIRSIGDELGLAHREDILQELQNLRTWLLSSGSNPYIQNKNGESAVDVDPEIKPKLKELVNELTDFR
jgi:hypothetical protein